MSDEVVICLDADRVGDQLELSLMAGDVAGAAEINQKIRAGLRSIESLASRREGTRVLLVGCDDVILAVQDTEGFEDFLDEIRRRFEEVAGFTMSAGIGASCAEAFMALRRAKLRGRNRLEKSGGLGGLDKRT